MLTDAQIAEMRKRCEESGGDDYCPLTQTESLLVLDALVEARQLQVKACTEAEMLCQLLTEHMDVHEIIAYLRGEEGK